MSSLGRGRGRGRGRPAAISENLEVGNIQEEATNTTSSNDDERRDDNLRSNKRLRVDNSDEKSSNYVSNQYDDHEDHNETYIPSYPKHDDGQSYDLQHVDSRIDDEYNLERERQGLLEKQNRMNKLREEVKRKEMIERGINPDYKTKEEKKLSKKTDNNNHNENDNEGGQYSDSEPEQEDDSAMMAMMGFSGFSTTKNTKVEDNHTSAAKGTANLAKGRTYRQYMNRKGGFNRALDTMK